MHRLLLFFAVVISFFSHAQSWSYAPMASGEKITHQFFSLSYLDTFEQAEWVAYRLTSEMLRGDAIRRNRFRIDTAVSTGSAATADYRKSGYDRGHLCPAADMQFSQDAKDATFLMSNMSPQLPEFNRGVWKRSEELVRRWAIARKEIFVITGPVFDTVDEWIGKNRVAVPAAFYKVLLYLDAKDTLMIGMLLSHRRSDALLQQFCVPVDSIEWRTGIDFFSFFPAATEERLEKEVNLMPWFGEAVRNEFDDRMLPQE